jgi:hypothetical protein
MCVCVCVTMPTRIQHENWIIHTFTSIKVDKKMDYNIFLETPPKHVWSMQLIFFISYAYQLTLANKTSFTYLV